MLGLRARQGFGSSRTPNAAKEQTTPVARERSTLRAKVSWFCGSPVRLIRIRRSPSKILLEVPGNAGVESEARVWIESNAECGERADDSRRPREINSARQSLMVLWIASKINPHPEVSLENIA